MAKGVVTLTPEGRRFETAFAMMDPAHCLAGGLFRSLAKGQQAKEKLKCWYGDGVSAKEGGNGFEFVGPDPLGPLDLRLLQVVAAFAGKNGKPLPRKPETEDGKRLRAVVEAGRDETSDPGDEHLCMRMSYYALAREMGRDPDSQETYKRIRASIERMGNVTIWRQERIPDPKREGGFKAFPRRKKYGSILNEVETDGTDGTVMVSVNPLLSGVFLSAARYTTIELAEARVLSDPGVLIHLRLCAGVNKGNNWTFSVDTLASYAWPDETENESTLKTRRRKVHLVLEELAALGWEVVETTPKNFKISRPSRKDAA